MRFHIRSKTTSTRAVQRRLVWVIGGLGACIVGLQFLAQGRIPALLTGVAADPQAEHRALRLQANLDDDSDQQRLAVVGEQTTEQPRQAVGTSDELTIDPELVSVIKDNSVGIRDSERDLYFMLLRRLRHEPEAVVSHAAQSVAFNVLMSDSKKFLGRVIRVRGDVRRISPLPTVLERELPQLYEVWLFNADGGLNPFRIVCSELPPKMPTGDELPKNMQVEVDGYYFKRYGYATADGRLHVAPLVLAKSLRWQQPDRRKTSAQQQTAYVVAGFIAVMLALLGVVWWRMRVGDRRFAEKYLQTRVDRAASDSASNSAGGGEPPPTISGSPGSD